MKALHANGGWCNLAVVTAKKGDMMGIWNGYGGGGFKA